MITNVYQQLDLSDEWLLAQVRILSAKVDELELRLRDEQGDAAFRDYEATVARQIGNTGDDDNVVRLRGRRTP
jgi:hypothetical protein